MYMNTKKEPSTISQKLSFLAICLILVYIPLNCVIDLCLSAILGKGITFLGADTSMTIILVLLLIFCLGLMTAKLPLLSEFCIFIAMPVFFSFGYVLVKIAILHFQLEGVVSL